MILNDPQTNWKFVGVTLVVGFAAAGWMVMYIS